MTKAEILKKEILTQYRSLRQFALEMEIPYSTLVTALERGIEGMAYGRDYLAPDWIYGDHPLRKVMNQEEIRISELVRLATEQKCQYIILERSKKLVGNFKNHDVYLIGQTANFDIYRNYQVDIEKKPIN